MALTIAFKYDDRVYIGTERYNRYAGSRWDMGIEVHGYWIFVNDPLYLMIIRDCKNNIVIKNISTVKWVDLLIDNLQEIIYRTNVVSQKKSERYKLELIVCNKDVIWNCTESGSITRTDIAVLGGKYSTFEKCLSYLRATFSEKILPRRNPKKIIKSLFSRYSETEGKLKIIELR